MDPARRTPRSARWFNLCAVLVLVGGSSVLAGCVGALGPLLTRDATPCIYRITPPADFVAKYQESIAPTAETFSPLPFGVQCAYVATSTGETALSIVPLWPTVASYGGLAAVVAGASGLVLFRAKT